LRNRCLVSVWGWKGLSGHDGVLFESLSRVCS
jgi:hypothetical protein